MNNQNDSDNITNTTNDSVGSSGVQNYENTSKPLAGGSKIGGQSDYLKIVKLDVEWANFGNKVLVESISMGFERDNRNLGYTIRSVDEIIHSQEYIKSFARCKVKEWYPDVVLATS